MSDFSKPEYASYVALCRELRLDRKWRQGDCVWGSAECPIHLGFYDEEIGAYADGEGKFPATWFWLPSLSDWLEMLEEFDGRISFWPDMSNEDGVLQPWGIWLGYESSTDPIGFGPTREEAAARLWMAVRTPALK